MQSIESKIKISESLRKSWKNRKDYIYDIVSKYPKIYNSWRSIRFTEKGKKIGCDERWKDFKFFLKMLYLLIKKVYYLDVKIEIKNGQKTTLFG